MQPTDTGDITIEDVEGTPHVIANGRDIGFLAPVDVVREEVQRYGGQITCDWLRENHPDIAAAIDQFEAEIGRDVVLRFRGIAGPDGPVFHDNNDCAVMSSLPNMQSDNDIGRA
tara:strand:- start:830 stop:1171 length:342 start_codon:yes stop_codon:yes gene_type:complete